MTTISDQTKFTMPVVLAMLSCVITGTAGVSYLAGKLDNQDRRLARIERKLGIDSEEIAAPSSHDGLAFAQDH